MQTREPLKARQQFKFMTRMNWSITVGVFIPLVFLLQRFLPFVFADIIAVAFVFCLYFLFLHKRIIAIKCPHCDKHIETNTPWICGVCGTKNLRVYDFPFVNRCEDKDCGYEPKAYKCHHTRCGKLIFLSPDKSEINFAKCVNMTENFKSVRKSKKQEKNKAAELHEGIQVTELEVKKAKLDVELKGLKENLAPPKMKSLEDKYRGMVKDEDDARKLKAAIDEECKSDPVERAKRHAIVDALMRETL